MIIESINVRNFRSIFNETLLFEDFTVLVGANGAGKSTFIQALDLFYNPSPKLDYEDFYNRDTDTEIAVSVTFGGLPDTAKELFSSYLQDDKLTVDRVFRLETDTLTWKYHGASLQCTAFDDIREGLQFKDRGKTAKAAYESVKATIGFEALPDWPNTLAKVPDILKSWETENVDKCVRQRDDGQFFGFKEVAQGYLGRFTRFLLIPAVRDASKDSVETRDSVITALINLVVRSVLANKEALVKLKENTQKEYKDILDPAKLTELSTLSEKLTGTLQTFVPGAQVSLKWLPLSEVAIPLPQADVKLIEDGYETDVSRTGHGLQRTFILTLLQHLAVAQHSVDTSSKEATTTSVAVLPNLILGIEEPELYQHPSRQRHLANILLELARGQTPGVADKTQIVYSTHSPLFVGLDRINQIRVCRKIPNGVGKPKITTIISTTIERIASKIWEATDQSKEPFTAETMLPRLVSLMTPWMNEGFFADMVVLVEGEDDRAAVLGAADAAGYNFDAKGIAVIPCSGKTGIDRPAVIFSELGIPVFIVWDSDKGKVHPKVECNRMLLKLAGKPIEDYPAGVFERYACFEVDLETTLRKDISPEIYDPLLEEAKEVFGISENKHAKKPSVVAYILRKAQEAHRPSNVLKEIVDRIIQLRTAD